MSIFWRKIAFVFNGNVNFTVGMFLNGLIYFLKLLETCPSLCHIDKEICRAIDKLSYEHRFLVLLDTYHGRLME